MTACAGETLFSRATGDDQIFRDVRLERVLEGRLGLFLEEHLEKSRIRGYSC